MSCIDGDAHHQQHAHALSTHLSMMSEPWSETFGPRFVEDVCGHEDVRNIATACMSSGRLPCMLFYGPPGTGKTCSARAIVRSLSRHHAQLRSLALKSNSASSSAEDDDDSDSTTAFTSVTMLEINASDKRTSADVVSVIGQHYILSSSSSATKLIVVLVDEADSMTEAGQRELGRLIAKCDKEWFMNDTRLSFIICCNESGKLSHHLYSQSLCVQFLAPSCKDIAQWISSRLGRIGWTVAPDSAALLALISSSSPVDGGLDMRHVVSVVQSKASSRLFEIMSRAEASFGNCGGTDTISSTSHKTIALFEEEEEISSRPTNIGADVAELHIDNIPPAVGPHVAIAKIASIISDQWRVFDNQLFLSLLNALCEPSVSRDANFKTGLGQKSLVPCLVRALRSTSAYTRDAIAASRLESATMRWLSRTSSTPNPHIMELASWLTAVVSVHCK